MFPQPSDHTSLRAEVPPFVPRKEWHEEQNLTPSAPSPLPRYVTTCYPFVQERQDGRWPTQQMVPSGYNLNLMNNQLPMQNASLPGTIPAGFNSSPTPTDVVSNAVHDDSLQGTSNTHSACQSNTHNRNGAKQDQKKVMKRNVGIQKEVGLRGPNVVDKPPMMIDSIQQTDFPLSIACKSLTERPSPLKKNLRSRRRRSAYNSGGNGDSSSDHADADIDSDSGYYSPKHIFTHKRSGGTSTSGLVGGDYANLQVDGSQPGMQRVVYLQPSPVPQQTVLYQVHPSPPPQMLQNPLPSQPTPPPSGQILGFAASGASVIMPGPSPPMMNHNVPITSRPPPGFPLPPGMLKAQNAVQLPNGILWNSGQPYLTPNYSPRFTSPQHIGGQINRRNRIPVNRQNQSATYNAVINAYSSPTHEPHFDKRKLDRRKQKNMPMETLQTSTDFVQSNQNYRPLAISPNSTFLLEDTQDFPGLGSAPSVQTHNVGKLSYSQALLQKNKPLVMVQTQEGQSYFINNPANVGDHPSKEKTQKSRKRWKKAERASKAADEEYAEISKEQENIQKALKKSNRNRKKQNVLDLGEIFSQLDVKAGTSGSASVHFGGGVQPVRETDQLKSGLSQRTKQNIPTNVLDATAPSQKRGKERETPKPKKPSALKKVILKEREEKKEQRLQQLTTMPSPDHDIPPFPSTILNLPGGGDSDEDGPTPQNPVQISVDDVPPTVPQIHSRRYREYCSQMLDKQIDETCTIILQKLVQFQDRLYQRDPVKAKMRRRLVMGLREVTKHLKLKKLKCVIISPNLEKIQSKGGLDDALQQILSLCQAQNVTYIFALGRKAMGRAVSKLVPVSIVGIFDYSGVEDHYKKLVELVVDAQNKYQEMVTVYQQEIIEANAPPPVQNGPVAPSKRFAHMTHSRNPSAASCISFASFISEPISELNEASNWRVMMDADGSTLSPPPEGDASSDEDSNPVRDAAPNHMPASRKDSGSTVVECKAMHEHQEVVAEVVEQKEDLPDKNDPGSLVEQDDLNNSVQKPLENSFSTTSTVMVPNSGKSFLDITPHVVASELQDNPSQEEDPADVVVLHVKSSSDSVQERVQMWLQDQAVQEAEDDADVNSISSQETNKEKNDSPEFPSTANTSDS
ncbi:selenocysteine insertion sequence-binding protein 2-like isoform X2 [Clavelina lepadiformis]|uniref:Ribosomal protein eL8/eL30/eS12/Gadd45 domain-containing protein n=1 Tax=Clavelina lepadiformis TaxID=159417 RepID=A0ABP0GWI3_CLALP